MIRDAFGEYYPALTFSFFAGAVILTILAQNPYFQAVALALSFAYYVEVRGLTSTAAKTFLFMLILFLLITVINPLFNTAGNTVLFTYLGNRPYTFESLGLGASTAAMCVTTIMWCMTYSIVMTTDKFTYLFGRFAPSLMLVFTMAMRFIPAYKSKTLQIATARECIGKGVKDGSLAARMKNGASVLSMLLTWSFENAIVTADSMRSRGYGIAKRTGFATYRFTLRDAVVSLILLASFIVAILCLLFDGIQAEYLPNIIIPGFDACSLIGLLCYGAFLAVPVVIDIREGLIWRFSISKI